MALHAVKSARQSSVYSKGCTGLLSHGFSRFPITDLRRTAMMPSQMQYPATLVPELVPLDWMPSSL